MAVENQRPHGSVRVALRRRHAADDRFQNPVNVDACFGADLHHICCVQADQDFDLLRDVVRLRGGQVDLIDDSNQVEVLLQRHVKVGEGLRFNPLSRVHHQQRALARLKRAADLVGEVHMAGRVDQVHLVDLPVLRGVLHPHGGRFDRDAALALQVHRIKHLLLHFAIADGAGNLQQPVGQRALAVVDVGNDGKITDMRLIHRVSRQLEQEFVREERNREQPRPKYNG